MRERIYKTDALILRRSNLGEADRVLLLATPAGKRSVIARGARKTTSRLAGYIELFTHTRLLLAIGRNLDVVTQSTIAQGFPTLRSDLERLNSGYYVAELYDTCTVEQEENPQLFQLLVATFAALDTSRSVDLVVRAYELRLLHLIGYRPHLQYCAVSHQLLTKDANRFSPRLGGVLGPASVHADRDALEMDTRTFKLLRYLQREPFAAIESLQISAPVRTEAHYLLRAYITHILEREPGSSVLLNSGNEPNIQPAPGTMHKQSGR